MFEYAPPRGERTENVPDVLVSWLMLLVLAQEDDALVGLIVRVRIVRVARPKRIILLDFERRASCCASIVTK